MKIDYSKSLNDIGPEMFDRFQQLADKLKFQQVAIKFLNQQPPRSNCLLCHEMLIGEKFNYRDLVFVICANCGHIQSLALPPSDYPFCLGADYGFSKVYPELASDNFANRKQRVYQPKLDWIVKNLLSAGLSKEQIIKKRWLELGCGNGYFLSALEDYGINGAVGLDADQVLIKSANKKLSKNTAEFFTADLAEAVKRNQADIYVAWFVIEHIVDTWRFAEKLKEQPSKTIFIFSVPVFGFSCLFEGSHPDLPARSLDGVVHTQMFTEESINYLLQLADYEISAQWIFGQDAEELLKTFWQYQEHLPWALRQKFKSNNFFLINEIQKQIDRLHLSDQRHIIAIRK